jgi:hypothetical protein
MVLLAPERVPSHLGWLLDRPMRIVTSSSTRMQMPIPEKTLRFNGEGLFLHPNFSGAPEGGSVILRRPGWLASQHDDTQPYPPDDNP